MSTMTKKKITEEKVWMKYYSEEAQNCELPRCTAYEYLQQRNAERIDEPAIHYYGKDISFRELYRRVDAAANAYAAASHLDGSAAPAGRTGQPLPMP